MLTTIVPNTKLLKIFSLTSKGGGGGALLKNLFQGGHMPPGAPQVIIL